MTLIDTLQLIIRHSWQKLERLSNILLMDVTNP